MANAKSECVKVVARCRPLSSDEVKDGRESIVEMCGRNEVSVSNPKGGAPSRFTFDHVFPPECSQKEVFNSVAKPLIQSVIEGYNGTIFAYGQTGSGKTFTMEGGSTLEDKGIIPNTLDYLFKQTAAATEASAGTREYVLYISYMEIYNECIHDLLSKTPKVNLELRESKEKGVNVNGLTSVPVSTAAEINRKLQIGRRNRAVASHKLNDESSRSHAIFTITVVCVDTLPDALSGPNSPSQPNKKADEVQSLSVGKLNLVDLAGSERASKTGATGTVLKEGIKINLSLSALGNVINSLVEGKKGVVPYRDSKLTRVLQDSLGGNTKTVMIANVGPADWNMEETMSTLRYATRAKSIKNAPKQNNNPQDAVVQEYLEEINRLHATYKAKMEAMEKQHVEELVVLKAELEMAQAAQSPTKANNEEVAKLRADLAVLQMEQDERARLEMQASFLRSQLRQLQEEAMEAEQERQKLLAAQHAQTAAHQAQAVAAQAAQVAQQQAQAEQQAQAVQQAQVVQQAHAVQQAKEVQQAQAVQQAKEVQQQQKEAAQQQKEAEERKRLAEQKQREVAESQKQMEILRAQLASVQTETVADYHKMLEQQDELARLRVRMMSQAGQQISDNDAELAAMRAQLVALQEEGGHGDLQQKEIDRLKALVETLQARTARTPSTQRRCLTGPVSDSPMSSPQRSLRADQGLNELFETLVLEMGFDPDASRQAILSLPCGTMDAIVDYVQDREDLFNAWRSLKGSMRA